MNTSKQTVHETRESNEQDVKDMEQRTLRILSGAKSGRMDEDSLKAATALLTDIEIWEALIHLLQNHQLRGWIDESGEPRFSTREDPSQSTARGYARLEQLCHPAPKPQSRS